MFKRKINLKFLLVYLKTLTKPKIFSVRGVKFLFWLSLPRIGRFSPVYIHARLSEHFSESQAGYGTTFRVTGSYQKAGTISLKVVTGRVFTISN